MAAIIFISIGVIASFFCAIVDGIIASEFIVSIACVNIGKKRKVIYKVIYSVLSEPTLTAHIHTPDVITWVSRDMGGGGPQLQKC